jgi:amino acid adenylation domain-containing protein
MPTRVTFADSVDVDGNARSRAGEVTTVRELIDRMAATQPDVAFLLSPETGQVHTFLELRRQARIICSGLLQSGLEQGDKVAFMLDNGLFTAQLFLGAMYGGFVVVPLNVRAGVAQLSFVLDHCDAKAVFVGDAYNDLAKDAMAGVHHALKVIPADVDGLGELAATPIVSELPVPAPGDEAMLMYTSGSVGQPKSAIHTHSTVIAHGRNSMRSHQLTSTDRSLLVLPLYHINAECVTLVPTLLSGGSVVVPHRFSVSQFWDWLDEYRCTWSAVVPTIVSQLLDWKDPREGQRQEAFARIRFLRSSSAPLSPSQHREFLDKFDLLLIQAMGSSEAGNIFSNPQAPGENKIGSPGLAWGFETRIVNREGADVASGESGEVLIRGDAMMRGYYKDPEGTAAVLDQDGWFHTGDLAYQDGDGYFFVVGRSKELIIKGGVNIAPRQIDDVLESHPAILEAAAVGIPDRHLGEDLVAFVVLRAGVQASEGELLSFCERRLGPFKTPTRIHFAKGLPKGPSGKVQRLRLTDTAAQQSATVAPAAPEDGNVSAPDGTVKIDGLPDVEPIIAAIWADLLGQPEIDSHTNFFALGGHSLLAIQCLSRLREKLPVGLSLSDFFDHGTIAQLAELVRQRLHAAGRANGKASGGQSAAGSIPLGLQPIAQRGRANSCPLSPGQRSLWFMEQLHPGLPVNCESEAVRLRGDLDAGALEQALNAIIDRHEVLRSTIQVIDEPAQVAHPHWPLKLKIIDLSQLDKDRRAAEVERLLIDEPRRLYHLEAEPGIRATLLRLAPREHVFILMMHHIVCDWSSEGVLWRELASLYRSFLHGEPSALPPLPVQHGDYAAWRRQQLAETGFPEDLAYWTENLRAAPSLLEMPTDRPRPGALTYRGARKRFRLDPALSEALRNCSRQEKTSLFTVFSAALNVLLHRYTGSEDILVGIPVADRDRPELQSVIGFLLQTHVLRTRLSPEETFRDLLARVQKSALALYSHRAAPFDQVVGAVQPERNLSYSPLFQVMLNWRDREQELSFIGLEGLEVESMLAESRTSKFDLTLLITEGWDEILVEFEYSTDLFDEDRMARMFGHYRTLLEAVAADPGLRVREFPLLTASERRQLLEVWNPPATGYPADKPLTQLLEEQVERTPHATAVEFDGRQLTYSELNERSTQFARHLRTLGVGPEVLAAVYIERSLEMVIALLGILKAGGAYLPVDLAFPRERIAFMLDDAQPRVLVTVTKLLADLPPNQSQVVCVDDFPAGRDEPASRPSESRDLAYLLYTSGSTGKPKGVEICHRALVNFLHSMRATPGMDARDTLLSVTSLSFDIFGLEIWLPLTVGAKVVIVPPEVAKDGRELAAAIERCGATVMQATPATWRLLLDAGWEGRPNLKILCGGEAWPPQLAEQLQPRCASLWNMYGPTETTIWSAVHRVETGKPILVGRPIANTRFYVVDAHMQPAPAGVPGELLIGGDGLARGYWNRPELTAEKFIPDPFSPDAAARLYRTGDLVRYLADGNVEFLGRIDHQVKLRGFRIELGEIESVLRSHPGVKEAVAAVPAEAEKRLVAYVVLAGEPACTSAELRDYLRRKLPDYMVPAAFVSMKALPLTPNGKVDRKALPLPGADTAAELSGAYVAPDSDAEQKIAAIWKEVLGVARVGRNNNFFDLGGTSLLLMGVHSRLRQAFGNDITMVDLFRHTTVRALAQHLLGQAESSAPDKVETQSEMRKELARRNRQLRRRQGKELVAESSERAPGN